MGMNQPPQGAMTDPSAILALMGQQGQDPNQMMPDQEQPPEDIVTYDDAIDSVLKLIVTLASDQGLDKQIQAKAISELSGAARQLSEASNPESVRIDLQGQMDQQAAQMEMEKHQQDMQHKQQLHQQTMEHNTRNQTLKEYQAERQLQQQQQKQESSLVQQGQQMEHAQQNHEMGLQSQAQQQELAQKESSKPTE